MSSQQFNKRFEGLEKEPCTGRRIGFDSVQCSIDDLASFSEKDVPHFLAALCNAVFVSVCTYYLFSKGHDSTAVRYAWPAAGAAVAFGTWECEELNLALFGGLLVSVARVLRTIYLSSDYEQLVWRLFTTWLACGAGLFVLLICAATASFRRRLKRTRGARHSSAKKLE